MKNGIWNKITNLKKFFIENNIILFLIVMIVGFSFIQYFFTPQNISNILLECSITAIIAIGMTFIIIANEIDLSVGSVLCFCGMIFASLSVAGVNVFLGFIITLLAGALVGVINGATVVWFKIPSFIITLAMMTITRGAALLWRNGETIRGLSPEYFWFGQDKLFNISVPILLLLIIFLLGHIILHYTKLGLYTYAIGSNQEASRLSGVNVKLIKIVIFSIVGALSAISGIITTSRLGIGSPITGNGKELDAIAAVILGGASLSGGSGSMIGTLAGALTVSVLGNGMTLLRLSSYWQRVVLGIVIIAALAFRKDSGLFEVIRKKNKKVIAKN
jgi:ribose transport system permease protein